MTDCLQCKELEQLLDDMSRQLGAAEMASGGAGSLFIRLEVVRERLARIEGHAFALTDKLAVERARVAELEGELEAARAEVAAQKELLKRLTGVAIRPAKEPS